MGDEPDQPESSADPASGAAPYLPPARSAPPPPSLDPVPPPPWVNVPPPPPRPADPSGALDGISAPGARDDGDVDGGTATTTLADRMATRNVPPVRAHIDYGLPVAHGSADSPDPESAEPEFVRPELESMGPPTTALLIARGLMVGAALLIALAARRSTGSGAADRAEAFWPVAFSAGVMIVVAIAGFVYWTYALADNAQRLKSRAASARSVALGWTLPIGWVVLSAVTYLRIDVDGELDPLPGVAGLVFAILLAVAYARLQGVFRGLSRRPPSLWLSAYPLDLVAFGLLWWRLTSWPDPVSASDWNHVQLTSNVAFGAAAALALNALVYGWLAQRGSNGVYERLGRLEARHLGDDVSRPDWFASGLQARPTVTAVDVRPLIDVRPLSAVVSGFHMLWGVATVALAVVLVRTAFEYSDRPALIDGTLLVDDDDADRLSVVLATVLIVYVLAIIVHGVWSVITATNARRVTVHAPNPASFGIIFVPMPVLVVVGLLVGGDVGLIIVGVGLLFAFLALLRVNQMLMTLSGRLGGELRGFSTWTAMIGVAYLIGVVENFLFGRAVGRLGFLGAATLAQGVLIGIGAVIGYRAMRELDATLRTHRQTERVQG